MRTSYLFSVVAFLAIAATAEAHPAPFSFLDLRIDEAGVSGSLTIHDLDAVHELGLTGEAAHLDPARARASAAKLGEVARRERALLITGHDPEAWAELKHAPDYYE